MMVTLLSTVSCVCDKQDVSEGRALLVCRWLVLITMTDVITFLFNINADDWEGTQNILDTGLLPGDLMVGRWEYSWGSKILQMLNTRQIMSRCQVLTAVCWIFKSSGLWWHFVVGRGVSSAWRVMVWCVRTPGTTHTATKHYTPSLNWPAPCGSDTCPCEI